jgi:hypothetical protein
MNKLYIIALMLFLASFSYASASVVPQTIVNGTIYNSDFSQSIPGANVRVTCYPDGNIRADINRDGFVNVADLGIFGGNFNRTGCSPLNDWCNNADLNRDGRVDGSGDLGILGDNYGKMGCDSSNNYCNGADINRDGKSDVIDLGILAHYFGLKNCSASNNHCNNADINHDGRVDDSGDLGILSDNYGRNLSAFVENTISAEDGSYIVRFSDACGINSIISVDAEKDGLTGSSEGVIDRDYSLDLNLAIINVPLVPEFGLIVGLATIFGAVGIFFFVRKR